MEKLKRKTNGGCTMIESMIAVMLVLVLTSSLLSVSQMQSRRRMENIRKREMYYAGLSAVRLMAAGIAKGEYVCDESVQKFHLVFESELEMEKVIIPVRIQSRNDEGKMIVWAEGISLTLKQEDGQWIPQRYRFAQEDAQ